MHNLFENALRQAEKVESMIGEQKNFTIIDNSCKLSSLETTLSEADKVRILKAQVYALKSYYYYKVPADGLPELSCKVQKADRLELQERLSQFRRLRLAHKNRSLVDHFVKGIGAESVFEEKDVDDFVSPAFNEWISADSSQCPAIEDSESLRQELESKELQVIVREEMLQIISENMEGSTISSA